MKIVPVLLRYDYGQKARGDSLEFMSVYPALGQLGHDVRVFWYDEYLGQKELLQRKLKEFIDSIRPDLVYFALMNDEFSFETLDYLRSRYTTVNWFADDRFRFDIFTRYYAPHFSYAITTDKLSLDKYHEISYSNALLTRWASFDVAPELEIESMRYEHDVTFVGMTSAYRKWIVKRLKNAGIHVECYGHGWINGRVPFNEIRKIFASSKINLNISNSMNYDLRFIIESLRHAREMMFSNKRFEDIKARNFEIPAFGGFQLTNYVLGLEDSFAIGTDVAVYGNIEELIAQIRYYLKNERERLVIARNGYERALRSGTYAHRLRDILSAITARK